MLTNNYYKICALQSTGLSQPCVDKNGSTKTAIADSHYMYNALCMYEVAPQNSITNGIVFGTGNTKPTLDDYTLSGDAITKFKTLSTSYNIAEMSDGIKCTRTMIIQNTGTEDFTISEIAWFTCVMYGSSYAFTPMVDRTILATPLTIPAGQTGQVDYAIYFKHVTA